MCHERPKACDCYSIRLAPPRAVPIPEWVVSVARASGPSGINKRVVKVLLDILDNFVAEVFAIESAHVRRHVENEAAI